MNIGRIVRVLGTGDVWTGRRAIEDGHAAVHKTIFRNSIQREHIELPPQFQSYGAIAVMRAELEGA